MVRRRAWQQHVQGRATTRSCAHRLRLPKNAHGLVSTDLAPEPLVETLDWQERYRHRNTALIWMQSVAVTKPAILLPPSYNKAVN